MRLRSAVLLSSLFVGCNALFGIESGGFDPPAKVETPDGEAPRDATPGAEAAVEELDAGPCVDLASNARHCGSCNHSCFGGACSERTCQPYALAKEPGGDVYGIAVSADSLFYNEVKSASIRKVSLAGGAPTVFYTSGTLTGSKLTIHGDALYFIEAGAVVRCPLAGCPSAAEEVVRAPNPIGSFAIDTDGSIVVAQSGSAAGISRCAIGPCNTINSKLKVVSIAEDKPATIAVAGQWVAWTLFGSTMGAQSLRFGAVGVEPKTRVTGSFILHVAMTSELLIYGNPGERLVAMPYDGLGPRTLASTKRPTDFLVIDGDALLYADAANRSVMRVPLDGKTPAAVIATDQANPRAIAVDSTSYYWVNTDDSTVMRLAR